MELVSRRTHCEYQYRSIENDLKDHFDPSLFMKLSKHSVA